MAEEEIRMKYSLAEEARSFALVDDSMLLHGVSPNLDIFDMYSDFSGEPIGLVDYIMHPPREQNAPIAFLYGVPLAKWKQFREYVENLLITYERKKYAPYILEGKTPDINTQGNRYPIRELVSVYVISVVNVTDNKVLKPLQTQSDTGVEYGWRDYAGEPVGRKISERRPHVSKVMRFEIYQRDGFRCHYCRRHKDDLPKGVHLTLDHKDPYSRGGEDSFNNLVTACSECNRGKSNKVVRNI